MMRRFVILAVMEVLAGISLTIDEHSYLGKVVNALTLYRQQEEISRWTRVDADRHSCGVDSYTYRLNT